MLLLLEPSIDGADAVLGVAMLQADPDGERADLGLVVRRVIGQREVAWLFDRLIASARLKGIDDLHVPVPDDDLLRAVFAAAGFRSTDVVDTLAIRPRTR